MGPVTPDAGRDFAVTADAGSAQDTEELGPLAPGGWPGAAELRGPATVGPLLPYVLSQGHTPATQRATVRVPAVPPHTRTGSRVAGQDDTASAPHFRPAVDVDLPTAAHSAVEPEPLGFPADAPAPGLPGPGTAQPEPASVANSGPGTALPVAAAASVADGAVPPSAAVRAAPSHGPARALAVPPPVMGPPAPPEWPARKTAHPGTVSPEPGPQPDGPTTPPADAWRRPAHATEQAPAFVARNDAFSSHPGVSGPQVPDERAFRVRIGAPTSGRPGTKGGGEGVVPVLAIRKDAPTGDRPAPVRLVGTAPASMPAEPGSWLASPPVEPSFSEWAEGPVTRLLRQPFGEPKREHLRQPGRQPQWPRR